MNPAKRSEYEGRIVEALRFVFSRLDQPTTPVDIADHIGFSRFHFGRLFASWTGESMSGLVKRLQLERAAHSLETTGQSVTEIAFGAGFESLEGFSRAFKEAFGKSPTEYRQHPTGCKLVCPNGIHWLEFDPKLVKFVFNGEPTMNATIKHLPTRKVIALRHTGHYHRIGEKFGELSAWAGMNQVPMSLGIAMYYDDPETTPPRALRSDACIEVPDNYELPSNPSIDVRLEEIRGGEYAVVVHQGSYRGLGDARIQFMSHAFPSLQRESAANPPLEVYFSDHMTVPESELITELCVPLK